ncbi:hypothetical protein ACFWB2_14670 [Streptomyces virginiae]|uniref:hypothetical protein n=1 Tax=Streptomyces TaxID=1883 RepID=UPI00093DEB7F|nr:hypothetical protein [Streptomyces sp. MJM1172]OKI67563.1 hypothetical protein AMK15_06225 [Streptomyces sp. MJM1172]
MEALGRLFDITTGAVPVDLSSAAVTGKRVHLKNCGGVTIVVFKAAGTAGDDPTFDLQESNAASGGTTQDLDIINHYYVKQAATLTGAETWTRVTQSTASEVTGDGTSAESQAIYVFEVAATQLSDGFEWVSLNVADVGANAQLGGVLYLLHGLNVQRTPENLVNPQA